MEFEEEKIKALLKSSKLEMPFSDFEDRMMAKIKAYEVEKQTASQSIKYATLFFLIGTVFGLILNYMISQNLNWIPVSIITRERFNLISQLMYVVLIILFSDKLWKLYKLRANKQD